MTALIDDCLNVIRPLLGENFRPQLGLILGSGSNQLAQHITPVITLPYDRIPGFSPTGVQGHTGQLILGHLNGVPVACLQGRSHYYEGIPNTALTTPIRVLNALGCEMLLSTNATGGINPDLKPGDLAVITDHLNFQGQNPLTGPNDESIGPRFPCLVDAYDPTLRTQLHDAAKQTGVSLKEAVYVGTLGPSYETPAEIRAFKLLGGDVVGMSTIPEVITARHCGMRVAVVTIITNYAAGLTDELLTHEDVVSKAEAAADRLSQLMLSFIGGN